MFCLRTTKTRVKQGAWRHQAAPNKAPCARADNNGAKKVWVSVVCGGKSVKTQVCGAEAEH